jgi:hypothetical protein
MLENGELKNFYTWKDLEARAKDLKEDEKINDHQK